MGGESKAKKQTQNSTYKKAGVDTSKEGESLKNLLKWLQRTFNPDNEFGRAVLEPGYFASVVDIGSNMGLAISTDGVGTKIIVAQMMNKYDTIGIDCIAMNVNDVICVGAKPISMVDYLAVQDPKPDLLEDLGKGLYEGARIAKISIPGGEVAQLREMIKGEREGYGFDLAGTCVGIVPLEKIIIGQDICEGESVVGLRSSGIHSNGVTLARKVLFEKMRFDVNRYIPELGRTLGEELLEPTRIYVPVITEMLEKKLNIKALIHVTGDGFLNLTRVSQNVGYIIDYLPEPQPIFSLIQKHGEIKDEEMFLVFNMGVGFCVVLPNEQADEAVRIAGDFGIDAFKLGHTVRDEEKKVVIKPRRLVGIKDKFHKS